MCLIVFYMVLCDVVVVMGVFVYFAVGCEGQVTGGPGVRVEQNATTAQRLRNAQAAAESASLRTQAVVDST